MPQPGAGLTSSWSWTGTAGRWRWEHPAFHHDMCRLPNGNTLVIVWEQMPKDLAGKVKGFIDPRAAASLTEDEEHFRFIMKGLGVGGTAQGPERVSGGLHRGDRPGG